MGNSKIDLIKVEYFSCEETLCGSDFDKKDMSIYINVNYIVSITIPCMFSLPFSGTNKEKYFTISLLDKSKLYIREKYFNELIRELNEIK